MSCSSGRAQTEPLAALIAVAAVAIGLSLYAGVLEDVLDDPPQRDHAEPALDRVERTVAPAGVVRPNRLDDALASGPDGYRLNVTVTADGRRWSKGPDPPSATVDRAVRRVSVAVEPSEVEPGELRVVVWR